MTTKLLNLFLRVITLGSKFLLSIYLVKYLGLEANGEYGIFVTTVTFITYLLGVDFYTFSTREILQDDPSVAGVKLRNQFLLFGILYLVLLPLISFIWLFDFIDPVYMMLFYAILICEHLSTELYRVLIIFSRPVAANVNLLLRSGIWILFLVGGWMLKMDALDNLGAVFAFWLGGSLLSIVQSLGVLAMLKIKTNWRHAVDWGWMRTGMITAMPFFIGTMAYKAIQFADRYLVDYYLPGEDTGTYIFFSSISMLVETFVQTTVIMIFSPKLVASWKEGRDAFDKVYRTFRKEVILYSLAAGVGVTIFIYPLLAFVDKTPLYDHIHIFFVMVGTKLIFNLSLLYHFYLYVTHKDQVIMRTTLVAVAVNIALNFILIPAMGMMGAALATLTGFTLILAFKFYYAKRHGL